jgi:hypothetical protein
VLTVIAQGMNVFSLWWIGAARNPIYKLSNSAIIGIYIGLVLGYGVLLLISTIMLPYVSLRVTEVLSEEIVGSFATVDLTWIERQNKAFSANMMGRVNRM